MLRFKERSYVKTSMYRPRPEILFHANDGYIVIATPWGNNNANQDIVEKIQSYLTSFRTDNELTSPFRPIKNFNKIENAIRNSILLANNYIFKTKNSAEYLFGFEIFVGILENNTFYFANIGHPHILLHKGQQTIMPVSFNFDHSMSLSSEKKLPPLPNKLIGISDDIELQIQSIHMQKNDQLLLISRSWIPKDLVTLKAKDRDFESYVQCLAKNEEQPFWFGLLEF